MAGAGGAARRGGGAAAAGAAAARPAPVAARTRTGQHDTAPAECRHQIELNLATPTGHFFKINIQNM